MGVLKMTGKILGGAVKGYADASGMLLHGLGTGTEKAIGGAFKAGESIGGSKIFLRDLTDEEKADSGFAGKLIPKRLTKIGLGTMALGTMALSTGKAMINEDGGMTKFNRLGTVSMADNLDRLISYDGKGYQQALNNVSQGDPEVMQDMVKNTFSSVNQYGASGSLVFALHNMRQG